MNKKHEYLAELHNVRYAGMLWDGDNLCGENIKEVANMGFVIRKNGYSSLTNKGFWECIKTIPLYWYYKKTHKM